jgi:hypothetical protein
MGDLVGVYGLAAELYKLSCYRAFARAYAP